MGFSNVSKEEIAERLRWEERYGEPTKRDHAVVGNTIRIGDEFFDLSEFEKEEAKPVISSNPFKKHHYDLQKDLDEIRAFHDKLEKAGK